MIVCPQCGNDSSIQKVSAIVTGGTNRISSSGQTTGIGITFKGDPAIVTGATHTYGISQSVLARTLTPPPKPQIQKISGFWYIAPFIFFMITVWFAPISKGMKTAIAITFAIGMALTMCINQNNNGDVGLPLIVVWLIILLVIYYVGLSKEIEKQKNLETLLPLWQKSMDKWNNLYYCHKHDIVFDPNTGQHLPADRMNELF